jgi:hypothetical protein
LTEMNIETLCGASGRRFFEENCATYAMTETKRLGPKKDDRAARPAVEKALSEEERQTDVDPPRLAARVRAPSS